MERFFFFLFNYTKMLNIYYLDYHTYCNNINKLVLSSSVYCNYIGRQFNKLTFLQLKIDIDNKCKTL